MSALDKDKLDNLIPATQKEAEQGADNVRVMTPLRVKQAIERYNYLTKAEFDDYSESID
jgi:hypothetical protein